MSIWYNSKKQEYASDGKNGWIKAYCDKVIEELKEALANHVKGTIGRHKAADVDYDSQNTVEDEIKQIYEELADEVSARVTEDTALDTKKADKKTQQTDLSAEITRRKQEEAELSEAVQARQAAEPSEAAPDRAAAFPEAATQRAEHPPARR